MACVLRDDFNLNEIDVKKWTETDPNSRVSISNYRVALANSHGATRSPFTDMLKSVASVASGVATVQATVTWDDDTNNEAIGGIWLYVDANNYISLTSRSGGGTYRLRIFDGGSQVYTLETAITKNKIVKITYDLSSKDIKFWYWDAVDDEWVQMGTTQNVDIGSTCYAVLTSQDDTTFTGADTVYIDDLYLSNADYSTQKPPISVMTLNPSALVSYINSAAPTTNPGDNGSFTIGERNDQASEVKRAMMKFDLAGLLPANATIVSATLRLYANLDRADNGRVCSVYGIKRDVNYSQVTYNEYSSGNSWQTAGATGANDITAEIGNRTFASSDGVSVFKNFFIDAATIEDMYDGTMTNGGLMLKMATESNDAYLFDTGGTNQPQLIIEFYTTGQSVVQVNANRSVFIDEASATTNFDSAPQNDVGESNSSAEKRRSLIGFDIAGTVPSNAVINGALMLIYDGTTDLTDNARNMGVYRLKRDWVEGQVTWNIYKTSNNWTGAGASNVADRETTAIGNLATVNPPVAGYKTIVLTAEDIQEMYDGTFTDNGFILINDTESSDMHRYEGSGESNPPLLLIDYIIDTIEQVLTETITITDSKIASTERILTEVTTIVDSVVKGGEKVLVDSIEIVDTIIKSPERIINEIVEIIDTNINELQNQKILVEAVTVVDSVIKGSERILTDAITIVDTILRSPERIISEVITIVDSIVRPVERILLESITLVDTFISSATRERMFSEVVTIVDTITNLREKILTEIITITDTVVKELNGFVVSLWTRIGRATSVIWNRRGRP